MLPCLSIATHSQHLCVKTKVLPPEEFKIPGVFGLFAGKNGSSDGRYTIHTGVTRPEKLSEVKKWRGMTHFDETVWKTKVKKKKKILSIDVDGISQSEGGEGELEELA